MSFKRVDGRAADELRPISFTLGYQAFPEGSCLIELGKTRVVCAVTVEDRVPPFLKNSGQGWVTAEYAMLPRSTKERTPRTSAGGQVNGRSQEIQRLIGRSLRAATNMSALGERTFTVDCDVLQADGGTRTASITGSYVALYAAMHRLVKAGTLKSVPLKTAVAAVSVGVLGPDELLDLCYQEDSQAGVDFNVVMDDQGHYIEIQGTAEGKPFSRDTLDSLLALASKGIKELFKAQKEALKGLG
jgi:ribonuclease PH